jgi:hypothetical protein
LAFLVVGDAVGIDQACTVPFEAIQQLPAINLTVKVETALGLGFHKPPIQGLGCRLEKQCSEAKLPAAAKRNLSMCQ